MHYYNSVSNSISNERLTFLTDIINRQNRLIKAHPLILYKQSDIFVPKMHYNQLDLNKTPTNINYDLANKLGINYTLDYILNSVYAKIPKHSYNFDLFSLKKVLNELNPKSIPKMLVVSQLEWIQMTNSNYWIKLISPNTDTLQITECGILGTLEFEGYTLKIITDTFYKPKIFHPFILGENYALIGYTDIFVNGINETSMVVQKALSVTPNMEHIISFPEKI